MKSLSLLFLQILGFDILLTKDLRPILLEVNASPSLTIGHTLPPTVVENPVSKLDPDDFNMTTTRSAPDLTAEPEIVHSVVDEVISYFSANSIPLEVFHHF